MHHSRKTNIVFGPNFKAASNLHGRIYSQQIEEFYMFSYNVDYMTLISFYVILHNNSWFSGQI